MTSYLRRTSPSMAVAILALVIAVSSSATAALVISGKQIQDHSITGKDLKKNAVKSKTIKNKTVKGKDLRKNAVKGAQVLDHSLTGSDFRFSTVTGKELADGTITSSDLSTTLIKTLNGGTSGFQVVTGASSGPPALAKRTVSAACPAGKVALSAVAHSDGAVDVVSPEVTRDSSSTFTAEDPLVLATLGAGSLILQVTCVNAG